MSDDNYGDDQCASKCSAHTPSAPAATTALSTQSPLINKANIKISSIPSDKGFINNDKNGKNQNSFKSSALHHLRSKDTNKLTQPGEVSVSTSNNNS